MRTGLALACVMGIAAVSPATAQGCDGIDVSIGAGERRCLEPGAGERFRDCPDCPEMVVVPAGTFTMGSPADEPERSAEREDQVRVTIAQPFAVGAFAVTRGEFAAFARATRHRPDGGCYFWTGTTWEERADKSWEAPGFPQDDRHPVTCVSLADATAYVAWLSSITGHAYRLPSETEREYVTRAGTATPFWWGSSLSTAQANYNGEVPSALSAKGEWRQGTLPVDSFGANPWGIYNVHGNVWDWSNDCWNGATYVRAAFRYWNEPGNRSGVQGFRVGRTLR